MTTVTVDDITYTFSEHALKRMRELHITVEMVELVMLDPDRYEPSKSSPYMLYVKRSWLWKKPLQVAVDEADRKIASTHWLKPPIIGR